MKTHTAKYLDNGFYLISDAAAGALVRVIGQKLPKLGYEKFVMFSCPSGGFNAWLIRTDVRHSCRLGVKNPRGWRWALHAIRRDGGADFPALGKALKFVPAASTQPTAEFNAFWTDIATAN